jgi:hypothetical protein
MDITLQGSGLSFTGGQAGSGLRLDLVFTGSADAAAGLATDPGTLVVGGPSQLAVTQRN